MEPSQQARFSDEVRLAREYLERANGPVVVKKLQKELKSRHGWPPETTTAVLAAGLSNSLIFEWPAYRRSARYWHRDGSMHIRERILNTAAETALTKRDLAARVARISHSYGNKRIEDQIEKLVKEGALKRTKAIVGTGDLFYKADAPRALLETSARAFADKFRRLGMEEAEVSKAFAITPPIATPMEPATAEPGLTHRVFEALQEMERGPVTVYRLRAAVPGASKKEFDQAILALAEQQRVYLTRHDHGWALPEDERERLVYDGGTNLYVAVTIRD